MKNKTRIFGVLLFAAIILSAFTAISKIAYTELSVPCITDAGADFEDVSAHSENTPYNWYCKHTKNGEIPSIDPQMKFIESYDGYWLDKQTDDKKVIYLTFDAGYENGNIKKILDVMKEKGVTGAFFILDNLINTNPEIVKQMAQDGHLICNHTASHKDMTRVCDKETFSAELESLNNTLREKLNLETAPFYRPPEGKFTEQNLMWAKECGYSTVFWSFAYADWDNNNQMDNDAALKKVLEGTHNGEVILLHPTSKTNAQIIGTLIDSWKKEGYTFGTLYELCQSEKASCAVGKNRAESVFSPSCSLGRNEDLFLLPSVYHDAER